MTANLLCPTCFAQGLVIKVEPAPTIYQRPYLCPHGHWTDAPRVREPGDVEAARRERLAEVMPHPIETAARDD